MVSRRRLPVTLLGLLFVFLPLVGAGAQALTVDFEGLPRSVNWTEIRLGRFQQTNQWERLDELSRGALEAGLKADHANLKRMGQWYQTLVAAQNGADAADVITSLAKAIEFGYENVQGIETADQLQFLRAEDETRVQFEQLVANLKTKIQADKKASLLEKVEAQREANERYDDEIPVLGPLAEGDAVAFVLSRTYHDGFAKQWPQVVEAAKNVPGLSAKAVFYEDDAESPEVDAFVKRYVEAVGVEAYSVIGRADFVAVRNALAARHAAFTAASKTRSVFNLYFPSLVVVAGGRCVYFASGYLEAWQVDLVLESVLGTAETESGSNDAPGDGADADAGEGPGGETGADSAEEAGDASDGEKATEGASDDGAETSPSVEPAVEQPAEAADPGEGATADPKDGDDAEDSAGEGGDEGSSEDADSGEEGASDDGAPEGDGAAEPAEEEDGSEGEEPAPEPSSNGDATEDDETSGDGTEGRQRSF